MTREPYSGKVLPEEGRKALAEATHEARRRAYDAITAFRWGSCLAGLLWALAAALVLHTWWRGR